MIYFRSYRYEVNTSTGICPKTFPIYPCRMVQYSSKHYSELVCFDSQVNPSYYMLKAFLHHGNKGFSITLSCFHCFDNHLCIHTGSTLLLIVIISMIVFKVIKVNERHLIKCSVQFSNICQSTIFLELFHNYL